jgi:hypothetical protein
MRTQDAGSAEAPIAHDCPDDADKDTAICRNCGGEGCFFCDGEGHHARAPVSHDPD